MTVVHLEEAFALHLHQFLRRDSPAEVGMVEMREHRLPRTGALLQHGVDVALDDLQHVAAGLARDGFAQVRRIEVDRRRPMPVGDFHRRDQQEPVWLLQPGTECGERLEPDLVGAIQSAVFDAIRAEAFEILVEHRPAPALGCEVQPAFAFKHRVMIGEREEVIALILVPRGHHLRVVIAIAPERVRVQVPLPPARRRCLRPIRRPTARSHEQDANTDPAPQNSIKRGHAPKAIHEVEGRQEHRCVEAPLRPSIHHLASQQQGRSPALEDRPVGQGSKRTPLILERTFPKSLYENVGQASSLTVHGASLPRVAGGRMPPEPSDGWSASHFHPGS